MSQSIIQKQVERAVKLLSHDMRTPLVVIETLCKSLNSDPVHKDLVRKINQNTRSAITMMNDFLFSVKAESVEYQFWTVLFDSLLDQAVNEANKLANIRHNRIEVKQTCIEAFVKCEPNLLERSLASILTQACICSEEGSNVSVEVFTRKNNDSGDLILVCRILSQNQSPVEIAKTPNAIERLADNNVLVDYVIGRHDGLIVRSPDEGCEGKFLVELQLPCSFDY